MMDVALWSKYPSSYSEGKIAPKLEARGLRVTRFLSPNVTGATDLSDVSVILCMVELASHAETARIKSIAQAQDKRMVALSRKESFWSRDLSQLEQMKMAAPKAVPDEKVEEFCNTYMDLAKKGMSHDQMIPKLQRFWKNGKLTNAGQLSQYVRNLVVGDRAPEFFIKFDEQMKRERREQKIAQEQAMEELAIKPNGVPPPSTAKPAKTESTKSEYELLDEMYKEEIEKLTVQVKSLSDQKTKLIARNDELEKAIKHHQQTIDDLNSRISVLQVLPKSGNGKISLALKNLMESVELGLNSKEEAFKRLVDFIQKSGA